MSNLTLKCNAKNRRTKVNNPFLASFQLRQTSHLRTFCTLNNTILIKRVATTENVLSYMCTNEDSDRAVWSESSLCAWRNFASLATQIEPSADSDQTAQMRRLIWIFASRRCPKVHFLTFWIKYSWNAMTCLESEILSLFTSQFVIFHLTLVLLNPDIPCFANSVDPDQLASEEANWSESALFAIKYANL